MTNQIRSLKQNRITKLSIAFNLNLTSIQYVNNYAPVATFALSPKTFVATLPSKGGNQNG